MPRRLPAAAVEQLTLAFPQSPRSTPAGPEPDLDLRAGNLVALHDAVRLLLGVAEGDVAASLETTDRLRASLAVLAAHRPGGRLGHIVRRYAARPPTDTHWDEFVAELAFVLSLTPADHPPTPRPPVATRGRQ